MRIIIVFLCITILSGCAFTFARVEKGIFGEPFLATRGNIEMIKCESEYSPVILKVMNAIDIPLSLITDAVLLPFDIFIMFTDDKKIDIKCGNLEEIKGGKEASNK